LSNKKKLNKFWSLKDTTNYSNESIEYLFNSTQTVRIFYFKKPFLLKVKLSRKNDEEVFVTPTHYMTQNFPRGVYQCVYDNKKLFFTDEDIIEVINGH